MNLEALRAALQAATRELHAAREKVTTANRVIEELPDDADEPAITAARTAYTEANSEFDDAYAEAQRVKADLEDAEKRERSVEEFPLDRRWATARGSLNSELVYRPDTPERSFFQDGYRVYANQDGTARERLTENARQQVEIIRERYPDGQYRDVGTGAFSGLVVPQYLVDLVAPFARAGAPLLNSLINKLQLPAEGLTLNISRITTGTATAAQATENAGVQETDADDTLLTINIRTYAGQQDVSRQAIERGYNVDQLIYQDLVLAYFSNLDSDIINADGTNGTHLGIRSTSGIVSVAYTDASPTVPELYPKAADCIQQINSGAFFPATTWVMHPRRWGWHTAALDSSNRPLVVPDSSGPFNALAVGEAAGYGQVMGTYHSLPVLSDANIVTTAGGGTEDVILAFSNPQLIFWREGDGMPRQMRFEQVAAPQSIRLAVWGYSAFTAGRYPKAAGVIGGTGLAAPTF